VIWAQEDGGGGNGKKKPFAHFKPQAKRVEELWEGETSTDVEMMVSEGVRRVMRVF